MTVNIHPTKAFHGFLSPTANVGLVQKSTLHFMLLMQSVALHASHATLPKKNFKLFAKIVVQSSQQYQHIVTIQSFKESSEIF